MHPREFHLDLGPCHALVRLHGLPDPVLDVFPRTRSQASPTLQVDLYAPLRPSEKEGTNPLEGKQYSLSIERKFITGGFEPTEATASFLLSAPNKELRSMERRAYSALRLAFSLWLAQSGGITLHGCSLVNNDKAFVFLGKSGSGKTTLVRQFPGDSILGDDLVAILPTEKGFHVWGTPFSGRERTQTQLLARPLAGVALLSHGRQTQADILPFAPALEGILRHTFAHVDDAAHRQSLLQKATALTRNIPVHTLAFHREQSPWDLGVFR
jgi:hypothetical protein